MEGALLMRQTPAQATYQERRFALTYVDCSAAVSLSASVRLYVAFCH